MSTSIADRGQQGDVDLVAGLEAAASGWQRDQSVGRRQPEQV
jgi:hypothetical protein